MPNAYHLLLPRQRFPHFYRYRERYIIHGPNPRQGLMN